MNVYTDGACSGNPGRGGWGWHIEGTTNRFCGGKAHTTNNEMELMAIFYAIRYCVENVIGKVYIHSDSIYCIKGIMEWMPNWKKKGWRTSGNGEVKNLILWKNIDSLLQSNPDKFVFIKVKGHSGIAGNELADTLANKGMAGM